MLAREPRQCRVLFAVPEQDEYLAAMESRFVADKFRKVGPAQVRAVPQSYAIKLRGDGVAELTWNQGRKEP